ncbi:restriction endonuclease subunit S [Nostoc cycadae]|uniref:Restriction modification system DNA specificity domain-containing protein n=1 Tax=Nostoc cycadae WK-1 TaxID=1861711 RepID=A0A2H6LL78_9NOSO|nr:restriction endonuclease subunit S [Nostoc cycadae]GBE93906.1 restriction modification system DNA specificity domain-containing protein [Nostoc cycadae WK-1]
MNSQLPSGWAEISFGAINEFESQTINPENFPEETFELWSVPSFLSGKPEIATGSNIGSTKQLVRPNDVLICKINPRINRVWQVGKNSGLRQIASSEWIVLRSSKIASDYLRYFFSSPSFREQICNGVSGVGGSLTRAQPKRVATFLVPVAPLNEQKRIVYKLNALLTRARACQERLACIPGILKRFRQAVLAAATSGQLTQEWRARNKASDLREQINVEFTRFNFAGADCFGDYQFPASWSVARLGDIAEIVGGITKDSKKQDPADEDLPYLRVANVQRGFLDLSHIKSIRVPKRRVEELLLKKGDILFTEGGDIDKLGRGWVWNGEIERCTFQNHIFRVRLHNKSFEPKFFSWYGNLRGYNYFLSSGKQTTNLASINKTLLSALPIVIPPLEEQKEITRRCEVLFAYADRLEARYQNACAQVERLKTLLLAKAFRGELVPQDPNDQPASSLLEQINAVRSAQPAKAKRAITSRKPAMTKMTKESVKEAIRQLPNDKFSFDELRENLTGDYDSLKDILFTLLSEAKPILTQVFDQEEQAICFFRAGK